ncbi:hypothetical protein HPB52_000536 [Rhipicephalus sanguineus]|uniref:Uncharacterized protein n=1 Tax=Rhipicephalus sanguineus TaxID=34632 RepID=A0A9D4Q8D8_RHISA|nr:hypothetical protein HPB52_000536 [Rhipicephalus sanguineus]
MVLRKGPTAVDVPHMLRVVGRLEIYVVNIVFHAARFCKRHGQDESHCVASCESVADPTAKEKAAQPASGDVRKEKPQATSLMRTFDEPDSRRCWQRSVNVETEGAQAGDLATASGNVTKITRDRTSGEDGQAADLVTSKEPPPRAVFALRGTFASEAEYAARNETRRSRNPSSTSVQAFEVVWVVNHG